MGFRRRRYLVNKGFQVKVMVVLLIIIFVESVSIGGVLYFVLKKKLISIMYSSHFEINNLKEIIGWPIAEVVAILTVATIIVSIVILFTLIKRVEVLIESFKNKSIAVGRGDLTIRPTDKYNDLTRNLSKNFDEMVSSLESGFRSIKEDLHQIIEVEKKVKKMVQDDFSMDEYGEISLLLRQKFEKLKIDLDKYRYS
jgi:methyl-accepting chemotaxis protein